MSAVDAKSQRLNRPQDRALRELPPLRLMAKLVRSRWWPWMEKRLARRSSPEGFESQDVFWLLERAYRHGVLDQLLEVAPAPKGVPGAFGSRRPVGLAAGRAEPDERTLRGLVLIALRAGESERLWRLLSWLLRRPRVRARVRKRIEQQRGNV